MSSSNDPEVSNGSNTSASNLRRSQSQSHVNQKPSQDLLGLSLHPIELEGGGVGGMEVRKEGVEVEVNKVDHAAGKLDLSVNSSGMLDTSSSSNATTNKGE